MFSNLFTTKKPSVSASSKPPTQAIVVKEGDDEDEIVNKIYMALTYEGFDVIKVREQAIKIMGFTVLKVFLTSYVMTGNALGKRIKKGRVADSTMANQVVALMKQAGIKEKVSSAAGLTIPRLAIAFPAIVIAIRLRIPVTKRVETSTPWELQDLCLNGYSGTVACAGCEDFVLKFSHVLAKARDKNATEEGTRISVENFRNLGRNSLDRDEIGKRMLSMKVTREIKLSTLAIGYGYSEESAKNTSAEVKEEVVIEEEEEEEVEEHLIDEESKVL